MSLSEKRARRELAIKRAKRNRFLVILACVLAVVGISAFFIVQNIMRGAADVYTASGITVKLYEKNSTFVANLSHNKNKRGSYTRAFDGGEVKIAFNVDGKSVVGRLVNGLLHLPDEWDDGHGHSSVLPFSADGAAEVPVGSCC
ncbi:MAG: hypothetical protein FWF94_03910 [Oscillospiraceae bacterium]|nr:hypothetical protein [Oscillospiraceae bacterium]